MKSLFLSFGLLIFLLGCSDDEHYSDIPHIEFKSINFSEARYGDTLALTFSYQDGNGDLGIKWEENQPWRSLFLASGDSLIRLKYKTMLKDGQILHYVESSIPGRLATLETRQDPKFSSLPPDEYPYSCNNYSRNSFGDFWIWQEQDQDQLLRGEDFAVNATKLFTENNIITRTLMRVELLNENVFYTEKNEEAFNIFVDFFLEQEDGSFVEFDWTTNRADKICSINFDGAFPPIAQHTDNHPFSIDIHSKYTGEITYNMISQGFIPLFGGKKIKLKIQIQDRALNKSNIIETDPILIQ